MSPQNLPDGFDTVTQPNGNRFWLRSNTAVLIAEPYPIKGFSQSGWKVLLVGFEFTAPAVIVGYDDLDEFASFYCNEIAPLAVSA